ncbi:MAG: hypothetical protein Kow0042_20700 [Calditrichia bacterium]
MMSKSTEKAIKSTTLISVIGKPYKGRYDPAKYELNGQVFETDFFFLPLLKYYQPDDFYLLGTKDSIWDAVEESRVREGFYYERVEIPFGISPEEIWQIFEKIVGLPLQNTRVLIDITHGFRAIPFAVFLAALYFQAVRQDVVIEDILYGNYEARDQETKIAPVVHLKSYLDMNEWIRAAKRFIQYGDGDLLIEKLAVYDSEKQLDGFLKAFRSYVDNLRLNYVSQIAPSAQNLVKEYKGSAQEYLQRIAPFRLLEPAIRERLNLLLQRESEWRKQWRIAEWFFSSRQYSQAVIVLREALYTFVCELVGLRIWSRKVRESEAKEIIYCLKSAYEPARNQIRINLPPARTNLIEKIIKLVSPELGQRWASLLYEVDEARNLVGHALMRGGRKVETEVKVEDQIKRLSELIEETYSVLGNIESLPEPNLDQLIELLKQLTGAPPPRLYLIVNEGVHPIVEDLKKQFGEEIEYEVVTRGNVELGEEAAVARRVKEILEQHHGKEIVIVPSGLPYLITVVYNTVLQITSKHPVYLQLDRENNRYVEKVLDPRKLML